MNVPLALAALGAVALPFPVARGIAEVVCPLRRSGSPAPEPADLCPHLPAARLAKGKHPEHLLVVGSFPLTPAGKPDRDALRGQLMTG